MLRWLWELKWALVIAIVAGPAWAYFQYQDSQRLERIMAQGAEFVAQVDAVQENRGRRGSRSYKIEVSWDASTGRRQATLPISDAFAEQIIADDQVTVEQVELKYLASEEPNGLVVAADGPEEIANAKMNVWFGIGAGIAGLILSPIMFWLERRNKKKTDEDIDATLARMRAGQQPQR